MIVITISLVLISMQPVFAGAPPPEYRVGYMLPSSPDADAYYSANQAVSPDNAYNITITSWDIIVSPDHSANEHFLETDYMIPAENPDHESPFRFFPMLAGYWRSEHYVDFQNDAALITLDWYCDNRSSFTTAQTELLDYLNSRGTTKNTTIDLSTALKESKNPYLAGLQEKQISVLQYESGTTAGYFTFHSVPAFPGDKYRISYYGTTGKTTTYRGDISDYGEPGTASLENADRGIQTLMVKKIYNLVGANSGSPGYRGTTVSQETTMPFFPNLSPYRGYKKLTYLKTGDQYISEVWFFNDRNLFITKKGELLQYLKERGTVSTIPINFSQERDNTTIPWNVTQFESRDTSGYFVIYESSTYPGTNLYILYYGVVGSSGIENNAHPLKLLILNTYSPSYTLHNFESPDDGYLPSTFDPNAFRVFPLIKILALFMIIGGASLLYWYKRGK